MPPAALVNPWLSPPSLPEPDGTYVLFCRYAHPSVLAWCRRHAARLAGVGLFLDDDIAAQAVAADVPLAYRWRLWRNALRHYPALGRMLDRVFVSTPVLAGRLERCRPVLLPPSPPPVAGRPGSSSAGDGSIRLAFHATAVHRAEHRMLAPVVAALLGRHPRLTAEVVVDGALARLWPAHPRLTLLPQLPWPDYRARAEATGADIALVPLADTNVNRARSPTRRIDAVRLGAAAVFSAVGPYENAAALGEMAVRNTPDEWAAAIERLITDPQERMRRAAASAAAIAAMRAAAGPLLLE